TPPRRTVRVTSLVSTISSESPCSATISARPRAIVTSGSGAGPSSPLAAFVPFRAIARRSFHVREGCVQSQIVALCAEAADLADALRGRDRLLAERLARMEVRQVNLDGRQPDRIDRVADRDRGVRVTAWIDHDRARPGLRL